MLFPTKYAWMYTLLSASDALSCFLSVLEEKLPVDARHLVERSIPARICFEPSSSSFIQPSTTTPAKPPHVQHQSPRRYVLNFFNRACIQQFPDVEVFKAFFFAFDESSLRDEFRSALDIIYRGLTTEMKREVASNWRIPAQFFMSPYGMARTCRRRTSPEHMESALMETYESGTCKISWVRIFEYSQSLEDPTTTEDFILSLEDPDTQTVHRLELRTVKGGHFDESIMDACVEMLKANRTIEYFHFTICESSDDDHPEAPLMGTNGRVLHYPLPPASCLAFLSVLRQYNPLSSQKQSTAGPSPRKRSHSASNLDIAKLDTDVISSIFAFAVRQATRRVDVNVDFL
ncbi:hypothetical protein Gpo141_00004095 [Globisporangium polare]